MNSMKDDILQRNNTGFSSGAGAPKFAPVDSLQQRFITPTE